MFQQKSHASRLYLRRLTLLQINICETSNLIIANEMSHIASNNHAFSHICNKTTTKLLGLINDRLGIWKTRIWTSCSVTLFVWFVFYSYFWVFIVMPEHPWNTNWTGAVAVPEFSSLLVLLEEMLLLILNVAPVSTLRLIFLCTSMHASAYPFRLETFLCPVNCAVYSAGHPESKARLTAVFRTEWFVTLPFTPAASHPLFISVPSRFLPKGLFMNQISLFSFRLWFIARKKGLSSWQAHEGRRLAYSL